jgi:excisionase family DNA binding protein
MMVAAPRIEPMLTPLQLAHRLQCSTKTVRRMVHGRKIPFVRVGPHGLLRFRLSHVENHLAVEVPAVTPPVAPAPPKPPKPVGGGSAPPS